MLNSVSVVIKNFKSKFLYRYLPKLVDFLTTLSIHKASKKLRDKNVKLLLIDNTVLGHGVTHETAWIDTGKGTWGNADVNTGYMARIPVYSDDDDCEAARSVRYLPGIINLVRRKIISLAQSKELKDEQLTQPVGRFKGYGYFDYSLFKDLEFVSIEDPDYTIVIGSSYFSTPDLTEQRKTRLNSKKDHLYKSLVSVLGPKNSQDAWHIATSEHNDCYCFLTMDFRLIRNVRAQSENQVIKSLRTKILTPEEFGREFGIIPMHTRLFSYNDAEMFVKHDVNWPDSERQKIRKN